MGCVLSGFINIGSSKFLRGRASRSPGNFEGPGLRRELFRIIIESMRIKASFALAVKKSFRYAFKELGDREESISEIFGNLDRGVFASRRGPSHH